MLKPGDRAPDIEATLEDGSTFRLSDQKGLKNVVLYFYPADFTGGCTRQACGFRDAYSKIRDLDAVIVGVSGNSGESHAAFKQKYRLPFQMIADQDQKVMRDYQAAKKGIVRPRITYVIDKEGVVRAAFRHDIAINRHISDTIEALKAIQS
jgi:peroxiredoxin Q/BCP